MDRYWILTLREDAGGLKLKIPIEKVAHLNEKIANGEPIKTHQITVFKHQIASFEQYRPPVIVPSLLDVAAQAFDDPRLSTDGDVLCYWVKQPVSAGQWNKYYSHFAAYQKIGAQGDQVMIAFRLPIHLVSPTVEKCSQVEATACEQRAKLG